MISLSLVVLVVTIGISLALMRSSRGDALGIPLVAIGSFSFLYVIQPLRLIQTGILDAYLTEWQTSKAILLSAVMLAFFIAGWRTSTRARKRSSKRTWNGRLLWKFGVGTASAGLVLYLIFLERSGGLIHSFSEPHGLAMAYNDNSAYLYNGLWWVLCGAVMMILGAAHFKASKWRKAIPVLFLAVVIAHAVLTGSRSPLFSAFAVLFISHAIAHHQTVSLRRALGYLVLVGFGVLLMLGYRDVLHLGEQKAINTPSLARALLTATDTDESSHATGPTGNEFIFHAATIDTVDQSGKLDYGVSWIYYLAITPIPKQWWPEKHVPQSQIIRNDDIAAYTGVPIAFGSACGIAADVYMRFGVFSVLFMYGFGRVSRRLFESARRLESPFSACVYVMLYAMSINMFMENFSDFFVPMGYCMVPMIIYTWSARRKGRKAKQPQQQPYLRQIANQLNEPCS